MRWKLGLGCVVFALSLIAGCSNSSNNGGGGNLQALAFGAVYKGLVANATVNVYTLQANGTKGRMLATGNTDNQGNFNIPVLNYFGWVVLAVIGGVATDFLGNQSTINPLFPLFGIANVVAGNPTFFSVSILTTLLYFALQAEMLRGGANLDTGIANAAARIALIFGISALFYTLQPSDLTRPRAQLAAAPADADNYGAIMNGFCELAINVLIAETILAHLLGRDLMDGLIDGRFFGQDIRSPTGTLLPTNIWNVLFPLAISNFILSQFNQSGLTVNDITTIAFMQALVVTLFVAPLILAMTPRYLDLDDDTTLDIMTSDVDAATAQVRIGAQTIPPGNVTDIAGGLRVQVGAALAQSIFATTSTVSVQVDNTSTGMSARDDNAVSALVGDVAPVVDATKINPTCAPTGGGAEICLTGSNLSMKYTTVTIGGQGAPIVTDGAPNKIVVRSPALAAGTYDIVVSNPVGPDTVVSNAITVKDNDLNSAATETDNDDQIAFRLQLGFNPDAFVNYTKLNLSYTSADSGTATGETVEIRENQTTPTVTTVNANLFRGRWGEEEAVLADQGSAYNSFSRRSVNDGVGVGLEPDAISWRIDRPTNATPADAEGRFYCAMWQVNYAESWRRYMSGIIVLGPNGSGALLLRCWQTLLLTGEVSEDIIPIPIEWNVTADGQLTFQVVDDPTAGSDLEFFMSGNYNMFGGGGELDGSVVFGYALRLGEGVDDADQAGQWAGGRISLETDATGPSIREKIGYAVPYETIGVDSSGAWDLTFREESRRDSIDSDATFDYHGRFDRIFIDNYGIQRNGAGDVVGAAFNDGEFGARVYGEVVGGWMSAGLQVQVPGYQSFGSATGEWFRALLTSESPGDGSSVESSTQRVGKISLDATIPYEIDGQRCPVSSTFSELSATNLTVSRDAARLISQGVDTDLKAGKGFTVIGRRAFLFEDLGGGDVGVLGTGALNPRGTALIFSDGGAGVRTKKAIAFKENPSGIDLSGAFRTTTIQRFYDGTGDRNIVRESTSTNFLSMGVVSGSFTYDQFGENNSATNGSGSITGSTMSLPDGFVHYQTGGANFLLAPNWDGTAFFGVGTDADGSLELMFGTRETTSAPAVRTQASLALAYSYDDFNPFPPVFSGVGGVVYDCFSGPGQITLIGPQAIRSTNSPITNIFQNFNTSSATYGPTGDATYSTGGSDFTGGASSSGYGHWSRIDTPNRAILSRISIDF